MDNLTEKQINQIIEFYGLDIKLGEDDDIFDFQFILESELLVIPPDILINIALNQSETPEMDTALLIEKLIDKYTVKELKAILREAKIKGYSKLRERELVELIIENNLH